MQRRLPRHPRVDCHFVRLLFHLPSRRPNAAPPHAEETIESRGSVGALDPFSKCYHEQPDWVSFPISGPVTILCVEKLVGVAGFEPATPSSRTRCATRLRYTPPEGRPYNPCRRKAASLGSAMTAQPATQVVTVEGGAISPGAAAIARAAQTLAAGGLAAFPTETVYGLGADATNGPAVARLYDAKERPSFNPFIAHVADSAAAHALARFNPAAERLAAAFWPGPLTLVLPKLGDCPVADLATAGLDTIAVRVPSHPIACAILAAFGRPIVAPSANRSGHVSPTTAQHVLSDLRGRIELIVDAGATPMGLESTIVACLDRQVLLRPGALARAEIERIVPLAQARRAAAPAHADEPPIAPGGLASHYAPRARLRLNARRVEAREALLAFGPTPAPGAERAAAMLNLSARGDLIEAAANLFSHLRALDAAGAATIAVMPVPRDGLGEAINDRLERAAAPRP